MSLPSIDYINEFQAKLGDAVSQALDLDNQIIGGLKAMELYSAEVQLSATVAGHSLEIPQELAIAYLVSLEAARYDQDNSKISLALSSKKRETWQTHRKLMEFAKPFIVAVADKSLFNNFMAIMLQDLQRSRQRAGA